MNVTDYEGQSLEMDLLGETFKVPGGPESGQGQSWNCNQDPISPMFGEA
jgi:hypothetical protein